MGSGDAGWGMGMGNVGNGSDITITTIYRLLPVCRADNRDNLVPMFA